MTSINKKIFLGIAILLPFVAYCIYYYGMMIKNAPYRFADFKGITFRYGMGDHLVNVYDSKSGYYQYVNEQDSIIQVRVRLSQDELLYLHRKAAELGFWNFPERMMPKTKTYANSPQYELRYEYAHKTKRMLFDLTYDQDKKLKNAVIQLIKEISKMISDAQERTNRKKADRSSE